MINLELTNITYWPAEPTNSGIITLLMPEAEHSFFTTRALGLGHYLGGPLTNWLKPPTNRTTERETNLVNIIFPSEIKNDYER